MLVFPHSLAWGWRMVMVQLSGFYCRCVFGCLEERSFTISGHGASGASSRHDVQTSTCLLFKRASGGKRGI